MAGFRIWTWKLICCIVIFSVSSQKVVNHYDWQNEIPVRKSRLTQSSQYRPNIILILADDMGWGDMGANWALTRDTPNLDALAKGGLRFSDFHAGASLCAPSRAALLTARLGLRTGVVKNFGAAALGGLPANETTLAEVLRAAGYRTAMMGKWHLGLRPGHHPLDKGFGTYLGVPYSVDMGCNDGPAANLPPCIPCPRGSAAPGGGSEPLALALPLIKDRAIAHQPADLAALSQRYAAFAEDFILDKEGAGGRGDGDGDGDGSSQPFLLYAAPAHVHVPLATAEPFVNASGRGPFGDALRELDWLVGRLHKAAETAARHQSPRRDTLVWFMSDNGPWEQKCWLAGSAGPYTGTWQRGRWPSGGGGGSASKRTVWEGGHRVPAFVHWPSGVPGGRVSAALVSALDVLPTLAAVAHAPMPRSRLFDGQDISELLQSRSDAAPARQTLIHPLTDSGDVGAVRVENLKIVYSAGGTPACDGSSAPERALQPPLVFDLEEDPAEATPLEGPRAEAARRRADAVVRHFRSSVRADNTSRVDYKGDPKARPCCWHGSAICRCPWD